MATFTCEHGKSVRNSMECDLCYREAMIDRLERIVLAIDGYAAMVATMLAEGDTEAEPTQPEMIDVYRCDHAAHRGLVYDGDSPQCAHGPKPLTSLVPF